MEHVRRPVTHEVVLATVAAIAEALSRPEHPCSLLPGVLERLLDATGLSRGALLLLRDEQLKLVAKSGVELSDAELVDLCTRPGPVARALAEQRPLALASADALAAASLHLLDARSAIVAPLVAGDRCLGVLVLASVTRDLSAVDWLALARVVAAQIAQALASARAVQRLTASERRYRLLVEGADDGIAILDVAGYFREGNDALARVLGVALERLPGTMLWDYVAPEDRAESRARFASLCAGGAIRTRGRRILRADGSLAIVDIVGNMIDVDGERVVFAIFRDVTEERHAAAEMEMIHVLALAAAEAPDLASLFDVVLRTLGEHVGWRHGAAWMARPDRHTLAPAHVWAAADPHRGHGAEPSVAIGEGAVGLAWRDGQVHLAGDSLLVPILVRGATIALLELAGATRSIDARFVKVASTVAAQLGSLIERRRAEDALRESEARFARLAESGVVGIAIADIDGLVLEANDACLAMAGYAREELDRGQMRWTGLAAPETATSNARSLVHLASAGVLPPVETLLLRRDGSRVPVLVSAAMLDATRSIAVIYDLTARKRSEQALRQTEEQLRHAQKMEAVGKLAGGVAHDFNNILSVIISYSDLVRAELPLGDPMRADLDEIHQAGERAAQLTRQLLAFSRQQVVEPRVLDLNEVIRGMEKMTRRLVGEDVAVTSVLDPDVGRVLIDPGSLEQIVMNLVVNARDAMPEGGRLTIETCDVALDQDFVRAHVGASAGRHVMLAVSDTGVGMDRATQARIFEPFFTTKPQDKGTGLGLSTVFGIVQQGGGTIWVYSEPGVGTTFKIYLPCVDAAAEPASVSRALTPSRGTETVLLVEDDDQVRVVIRGILEREGYRVLEARNAGEALLIAEQPHTIDLVLSDVVMPHMSGPEVVRRIAAGRPGIRVLCMSGYTDNAVLRHHVLDRQIAFLQKPITPATLARKVREVLDAPPAVSAA